MSLFPLFQNESLCESIHMKVCSTHTFIFMQIKLNLFWYEKFCTRTRFKTEAQGNSEMTYFLLKNMIRPRPVNGSVDNFVVVSHLFLFANLGRCWNYLTECYLILQVNIYLNCGERYEDMIDHRSYAQNLSNCEVKAWKNSGLNEIRTHDLCDTGAVLYQLSYQAIWELVTYPYP